MFECLSTTYIKTLWHMIPKPRTVSKFKIFLVFNFICYSVIRWTIRLMLHHFVIIVRIQRVLMTCAGNPVVITCLPYYSVDYVKKNISRFMSFSLHSCRFTCLSGDLLSFGCKTFLDIAQSPFIPGKTTCNALLQSHNTSAISLGLWLPRCDLACPQTNNTWIVSLVLVVSCILKSCNFKRKSVKDWPQKWLFRTTSVLMASFAVSSFCLQPSRSIAERICTVGDNQQFCNTFPVPCMACPHHYQKSLH